MTVLYFTPEKHNSRKNPVGYQINPENGIGVAVVFDKLSIFLKLFEAEFIEKVIKVVKNDTIIRYVGFFKCSKKPTIPTKPTVGFDNLSQPPKKPTNQHLTYPPSEQFMAFDCAWACKFCTCQEWLLWSLILFFELGLKFDIYY